jgi:hypothetical protein
MPINKPKEAMIIHMMQALVPELNLLHVTAKNKII